MSNLPTSAPAVGQPLDRVDGRLKVTGRAKYSAEFTPAGTVYAFIVESTVAKGQVRAVDAAAAERAPGVLGVLTFTNAPKLAEPPNDQKKGGQRVELRMPLSDDRISYAGQPVALVVAETYEQARFAARLVRVDVAAEHAALTKEDARGTALRPKESNEEEIQIHQGNVDAALHEIGLRVVEESYVTPRETHNPIEPSATLAVWEAPDRLTLFDASQYVKGAQAVLAHAFGLPRDNVRVICPFLGGGFGCKSPVWAHTVLAAMAAKTFNRPVKLPLTRMNTFSITGHRAATEQAMTLGARADGSLQAMRHHSETFTSPVGNFIEACGLSTTGAMYPSPAIDVEHILYQVNLPQNNNMRAPGEAPGTFALESAMDELAYLLKMDPVALRMANYSKAHPVKGHPFSTKHLDEAYQLGAEKFGWERRNPEPRSMRDGNLLVGWGMATAVYPAYKRAATAKATFKADGSALVQCACHDLGTGAYTAFTQISADALGVPVERVHFEMGDSNLPFGPAAGGSNTTATVGNAIVAAAAALHAKLGAMAVLDPGSPLRGINPQEIVLVAPGRLGVKGDAARSDGFVDLLTRAGQAEVKAEGSIEQSKPSDKLSFYSFGAQFCEVKIDPDLPEVHVTRFISVMDCARIINPKTARSQVLGGIVMGIGMALSEESVHDPVTGLFANRNLAEYHVPVNADITSIEPFFVGEPDYEFNPVGGRGLGEIGVTGTPAAVANAVFHATGIRVRDLPITPDKLL